MKYKNLYYFVVIIYLISFNFAYSIDRPDIKNLIIYEEKKKIDFFEFTNSKSQKVRLSDFNEKIIIINFWATWCGPCRKEMPSLDRLQSNQKLENIKILPINIGDETLKKSEKFFYDLNIKNLEFFTGSSIEFAKRFNLRGIPTTILIDKDKYEFARIIGYINFQDKLFLDWLKNYL